jgi:hypothetical protein
MQELIASLVSQLGVTPSQAQGGASAIFKAAQERLGHGEFERLLGGLPGVKDLLAHGPSPSSSGGGLSGVLGGLASLAAKAGGGDMAQAMQLLNTFNSLGLNKDMAMKFLPVVLQFVEAKGGKELVTQLRTALKF